MVLYSCYSEVPSSDLGDGGAPIWPAHFRADHRGDRMEPSLVVVSGSRKGTIAPLNKQEMTIGRDADSDLCLNEEAVSRKHCAIKFEGGIYRILDLNSSNGTFVNGIPVREKILQHGNTIRLGYTVLVFLNEENETKASTGPTEQ